MSKAIQERGRPRGLLRLFLRLPIWLYRLRLGWLLGQRFLMLEHTGRRSGLKRHTVLEVVDHDRPAGRYVVASGWGAKSDWYRNIRHTPQVTVRVGGDRFPAFARTMESGEAITALSSYAKKNPRAFQMLAKQMLGEVVADPGENCRQLAAAVPLVELERSGP